MPEILKLGTLEIAARVEAARVTGGGYLLRGPEAALLHPFGRTDFYRHGFHTWSLSNWLPLGVPLPLPAVKSLWPQIDHPDLLADYPFSGSGVAALAGPEEKILLLGGLGPGARLSADEYTLRGRYTDPERAEAWGWFAAYGPEEQVFTRYTELLDERLGSRGAGNPPRVWCSWYGYYAGIDEGRMHAVLEGLKGLPLDVFQVDDGWQAALGDWRPNEKFPYGMADLAGRIHAAGLRAGLWLAPLIVGSQSEIYREHPEWLLVDDRGDPVRAGYNWGATYYALDVSRPEVQDWLYEEIRRVIEWDYDYLKLDFLYSGALPGRRYRDVPGETAYREALAVMRQAAGDAYLLACGAPVIASLGLVDGMRIGPDVAPYWDDEARSVYLHDPGGPSALNALRTSLHRLWLRPLVHVDPDVVYFRTRYNLLTPRQRELLRALAQISGFRATSDPPEWLDEAERRELQSFLEARPAVEKLGRYRYRVGGQEFDFSFVS